MRIVGIFLLTTAIAATPTFGQSRGSADGNKTKQSSDNSACDYFYKCDSEIKIKECVLSQRRRQVSELQKRISNLDNKVLQDSIEAINALGKFYIAGDFKLIDDYSHAAEIIKEECIPKKKYDDPYSQSFIEEGVFLDRETLDKEFVNYKKAYELFLLASKAGSDQATLYLAEMIAMGKGVPADANAALTIVLKVAKKGDVHAQWDAAQLYRGEPAVLSYLGESVGGVIPKNKLSYMWFNIASGNGLDRALSMRVEIGKKLSKEETAQAQALSTECLKSNYKNCGDDGSTSTSSWWQLWK